MGQIKKQELTVEKFGENLSIFAINRDDLKELICLIPKNCELNLTTVEYELQILKIISIGWAISFYMPQSDVNKKALTQIYWSHVREISKNISNLTGVTTGNQIDYFEILKTRLDRYVGELQKNPDSNSGTASIVGSVFAEICKSENDAIAILTGTKMFTITIGAIKEYLNAVEIKENREKNNEN
ncbi:MAG: hypothetical protein GY707_07200 [Desulfobacteraceae bacterium]|nr:hypothetical protein [Desulfobacteraceae bacterium]